MPKSIADRIDELTEDLPFTEIAVIAGKMLSACLPERSEPRDQWLHAFWTSISDDAREMFTDNLEDLEADDEWDEDDDATENHPTDHLNDR